MSCKKLFGFLFLILWSFVLSSQISEGTAYSSSEMPRFALRTVHPLLGLNGEYRIFGGVTAFTTVNTSLWSANNELGKLRIATPAYFTGGVNWYHNLKKRIAEGKDVSHFAGNFISLSTTRQIWNGQYTKNPQDPFPVWNRPELNLSYNVRRNFGRNNRFYVEFGAGASFRGGRDVFGKLKVQATPLINLKIGINLK